jgi:hypothetical protein
MDALNPAIAEKSLKKLLLKERSLKNYTEDQ